MFSHKQPEVLVVGAGPVGLFTALALVHRGVRVQIVDKGPSGSSHSYALALHAETLRLLEEVGALGDVLERAHRVRRVGIHDATTRRAELIVSDVAEDYSFLAVLPQRAIEDHLAGILAQRGVKVEWCRELSQLEPHEDRVGVTIDRMSLETLGYSVQHAEWVVAKSKQHQVPYLVGADGHASIVRRRLGVEFPSVGASSDFLVFEFRTDADLRDEMRLVFAGDTVNACWPLPDGYCRWSFEMRDGADFDERRKDDDLSPLYEALDPRLGEERLRALLAERARWFRGRIDEIRWRKAVHFERRLAESFGRGRVWLAGDAGHLAGPVGMHSMNVGFREGAQLAAALAGLLHGAAGPEVLERYEETRRAEWLDLLGVERALHAGPDTDPWVAAHAQQLADCIPASGADHARLAGQLGFVYRSSSAAAAR